MTLQSHGITHPGNVREHNEDRILLNPALGLYAVFDGMGGQQRGELAAEIAASMLHHYVTRSRDPAEVTWPFGFNCVLSMPANRLLTSIRLANRQVFRRAEESLECAGMGSTVAAVLVNHDRVVSANVGDSRVYRYRQGVLEQLSTDDSVVSMMLAKGLLKPEQVRNHPMRSVLTQAVGSKDGVEVHLRDEGLADGDILLISSDGLHGFVAGDAIGRVLGKGGQIQDIAGELIEMALKSGSTDNISVVLARSSA